MVLQIPLCSTNLTIHSPDAVDVLCGNNLPLVGLEVGEIDVLGVGHIHNRIVQILRYDNLLVVGLEVDVCDDIRCVGYALELHSLDIGLLSERNGGGVGRAIDNDIAVSTLHLERSNIEVYRRLWQVVLDTSDKCHSRKEYNRYSFHFSNLYFAVLKFCSFFLLHKCTVTPMLISVTLRRNANFEWSREPIGFISTSN